MRGAERVVFAFGALGEAGQAAALPQRANAVAPAGENFVRIGLVADIPDQPVRRRIEDIMQRDCQLDNAEPCTEMPAGLGDGVDSFGPQLVGELLELLGRQILEIARQMDAIEQGRLGRFGHAQLQRVGFTAGKPASPQTQSA